MVPSAAGPAGGCRAEWRTGAAPALIGPITEMLYRP